MKKQYLSTLLFLALVLGMSSPARAQVSLPDDVREGRTGEVRTGIKTNVEELRATFEAQRAKMEAQREKMRSEIETRRTNAESRGDDVRAKFETKRLELETKRADMDAKREVKRVEAETKRAESELRRASSTEKRIAFQQEAAKRQLENATRVILATIERLEKNLIVRIESRIAKVKAEGGVTSESEGFLATAKTHLSEARTVVGTFASIDLTSVKARENFEKVRAAAKEAREHIRTAHQALMMAVRSLSSVEAKKESDDSGE